MKSIIRQQADKRVGQKIWPGPAKACGKKDNIFLILLYTFLIKKKSIVRLTRQNHFNQRLILRRIAGQYFKVPTICDSYSLRSFIQVQ